MHPLPLTMTFLRIRVCVGVAPGGAKNDLLGVSRAGRLGVLWFGIIASSVGLLGVSSTGFDAFDGVGTGVFSDGALYPLVCCVKDEPFPEVFLVFDTGSGSAYLEAIILPIASFSSVLKWRQKSCWFRVLLVVLV
jgi:hypothetical protein